VKLLLEKGADITAEDSHGETALLRAAHHGHERVVQLLLEKGAPIDTQNRDGMTPLYAAAQNGHEAVVRLLLEKGADVEAKDSNGRTALFVAAHKGHEAVVRLVLEKGADVETKDTLGRTALSTTKETAVQLLLENPPAVEGPSDTPESKAGIPPLIPPASKIERSVCKIFRVPIVDFYVREGRSYSLRRAMFNVNEVIYDQGPKDIMSKAAEQEMSKAAEQEKPPLEKKYRLFRWIHLPANNVSQLSNNI
jgi:hypothetical protein